MKQALKVLKLFGFGLTRAIIFSSSLTYSTSFAPHDWTTLSFYVKIKPTAKYHLKSITKLDETHKLVQCPMNNSRLQKQTMPTILRWIKPQFTHYILSVVLTLQLFLAFTILINLFRKCTLYPALMGRGWKCKGKTIVK